MDEIAEAAREIRERMVKGKPFIIGISGFGGAGKTTVAEKLGKILDAQIVGVDQFMKDNTLEDYSLWEAMDFERLEKEVLKPFQEGGNPIIYGHYDWTQNRIVKTVNLQHKGILIVEGVGLFRPELLSYFSYTIWVDCPPDIAYGRGKNRDRYVHQNPQDPKWDGVWKRNDEEYFENWRPKEVASKVVDNCTTS